MQLRILFVLAACVLAGCFNAVLGRRIDSRGEGLISKKNADFTIRWTGFEEVGADKEFFGSIQNVERQIQQLKPDFSLNKAGDGFNGTRQAGLDDEISDDQDITCCDPRNTLASMDALGAGWKYLRALPDSVVCAMGPAPEDGVDTDSHHMRGCGRISCSYETAISICNYNPWPVEFRCNMFADYVEAMFHTCTIIDCPWMGVMSGVNHDLNYGVATVMQYTYESDC